MSPRTARAPLRFLGVGDPDHLDPVSPYHARPGQILRALRRGLFGYRAAGACAEPHDAFVPVADLASEIPTVANGGLSDDLRRWTIRLRAGAFWDTSPPRAVTARDAVRAFDRVRDAPGVRAYFDDTVTGVRALGERTLEIALARPANDLAHILALGVATPAPAEDARGARIADGPYRIAARPGAPLLLERNPAWDAAGDPLRRQAVDAVVAGDGVREDEADPAWPFAVVSWSRPDRGALDFPRSCPGWSLNPYLVFNLRAPESPVRHLAVRRAVALAVDKAALAEIFGALAGVAAVPLGSAIPPGSPGFRAHDPYATPSHRGDPERARALLRAAGYGDGLALVAAVRDVPLHREVMRSVARDLARCGIALEQRLHPRAGYYGELLGDPRRARAGEWDLAEVGWSPDWYGNNHRAALCRILATDDALGTTNFGGYSNPLVDARMERALQEPDPVVAAGLWHEADAALMDELPIVPILAFACRCCVARAGSAGWEGIEVRADAGP